MENLFEFVDQVAIINEVPISLSKHQSKSKSAHPEPIVEPQEDWSARMVRTYGDLIYDLCESILWSKSSARISFRSILRQLRRDSGRDHFVKYERNWVLQVTCFKLMSMAKRYGRKLSSSEQMMLDSALDLPDRINQFESYFHRLTIDEQIVLILRDKHGFPDLEIASILSIPEGSVRVIRQQALESLEEWLWGGI